MGNSDWRHYSRASARNRARRIHPGLAVSGRSYAFLVVLAVRSGVACFPTVDGWRCNRSYYCQFSRTSPGSSRSDFVDSLLFCLPQLVGHASWWAFLGSALSRCYASLSVTDLLGMWLLLVMLRICHVGVSRVCVLGRNSRPLVGFGGLLACFALAIIFYVVQSTDIGGHSIRLFILWDTTDFAFHRQPVLIFRLRGHSSILAIGHAGHRLQSFSPTFFRREHFQQTGGRFWDSVSQTGALPMSRSGNWPESHRSRSATISFALGSLGLLRSLSCASGLSCSLRSRQGLALAGDPANNENAAQAMGIDIWRMPNFLSQS